MLKTSNTELSSASLSFQSLGLDLPPAMPGFVYLIGAGPGAPGLLTVRALQLMKDCDVIVYDKLVSSDIMDLVSPAATLIYAGKSRDAHHLSQEEINNLLIVKAKQNYRVLRIKGGDPFVFGRGGEEMQALIEAGISFEIVPGITAATGVTALAGIPLTHRQHAQACIFITAHANPGQLIDLDWRLLANKNTTIVVYMGLLRLGQVCEHLIRSGLPTAWPVAVIQKGTTSEEKVIVGNLDNIIQKTRQAKLSAPVLVVIGSVVTLRKHYLHEC